MKLALRGTHIGYLGYGTLVQNLVKGLEGGEDWLGWHPHDPPDPAAETTLWVTPPCLVTGGHADQFHSVFTMWEATRLPEPFRENMHHFDQVIVPCDQNVELFSRYHPNVVKVPLGYDSDVWSYVERTPPTDEFRFLCAGAGLSMEGGRKGFDLAAKAFLAAFPHWEYMTPRPKLVTKSLRWVVDAPYIECHATTMPLPELQALVAGCHAYVGPSRGEGWGYWPQQALATGMPTILSAIPAHLEYGYMPGCMRVPVTYEKASYFIHGDAGRWWLPDHDVLVDAMREAYANWEFWVNEARDGAAQMAATLTHTHMAEQVRSVLGTGTPGGLWRPFTPIPFDAEIIRHVECDIGETHYDLAPGIHSICADAQRVLREAGYASTPADDDDLVPIP